MKKTLSILLAFALIVANFSNFSVNASPVSQDNLPIKWLSKNYESVRVIAENKIIAKQNGKYGVIDFNENVMIPFEYDSIMLVSDERYLVNKGGKVDEDFMFYVEGGKFGVVDEKGNVVIPLKYDDLSLADDNLLTAKLGKKYGVIDLQENVKVPFKYAYISSYGVPFSANIGGEKDPEYKYSVNGGKWGMIDANGNEIIPFIYNESFYTVGDLAIVSKGGTYDKEVNLYYDSEYGLIDEAGKVVVPFAKGNISKSTCENDIDNIYIRNLFAFEGEDKEVYDNNGKNITKEYAKALAKEKAKEYRVDDFITENLLSIKKNNKGGIVNKTGKIVQDSLDADQFLYMINGVLAVKKDNKYGLLNKEGKLLIDYKYDELRPTHTDFIIANKGGRFNEEKYELIGGKYGVIDKSDKEIVPIKYDDIDIMFGNDMLIVTLNSKQGIMTMNSNIIIPIQYDEIKSGVFDTETFIPINYVVVNNDKYGIVDDKGNAIIEMNYDFIDCFYEYTAFEKDGKWGILKNTALGQAEITEEMPSNSDEVKAVYSTQNITVNGKEIKGLEVYSIEGHNYFKLRDIAKLANDKDAKFSVNWNGAKKLISLKTGEAYQAVGTELQAGNGMDKVGVKSTAQLEVNGNVVELEAYTIEEQTYFQIRELGEALSFDVKWNNTSRTVELEM